MPGIKNAFVFFATLAQSSTLFAQAPQLPAGPGRDLVQKVCGSTCHGPEMLMRTGRTRDQWTAVVNAMVTRGAKVTESELPRILEYVASNLGPNIAPMAGMGPGTLGAGAADSHVVNKAGAERGRAVYAAECSS